MATKFVERIPTVSYGYVEFEADTFNEFVEAAAGVQDHLAGRAVTEQQAIQNLQAAGLVAVNPGLRGPVPQPQQQPAAAAPPAQQWQPSVQQSTEPTSPQEYCQHGPKRWVPPGVSKTTNRAFPGFWACPAPRGQQCPRS